MGGVFSESFINDQFLIRVYLGLDNQNLLLVEACLRCLRTIYATDIAPVHILYEVIMYFFVHL